MIIPADTTVTFSGPRALDQAVTFIDDCPPGSAVLVGDGTSVKVLRSVETKIVLAEKDAVRRYGRGERTKPKAVVPVFAWILFLALLLGSPSGAAAADLMLGGITSSAPAAILAQSSASADWVLFGKIVVIIGALAAIIPAWRLITGQKTTTSIRIEEPLPKYPAPEPRWATWEEVETLRKDLENLRAETREQHEELTDKLDEKFNLLSRERSVSVGRLHDKIEAVAQGLRAEIEAKAQETRVEINTLPGKVVALLRDTGAIGGRKS